MNLIIQFEDVREDARRFFEIFQKGGYSTPNAKGWFINYRDGDRVREFRELVEMTYDALYKNRPLDKCVFIVDLNGTAANSPDASAHGLRLISEIAKAESLELENILSRPDYLFVIHSGYLMDYKKAKEMLPDWKEVFPRIDHVVAPMLLGRPAALRQMPGPPQSRLSAETPKLLIANKAGETDDWIASTVTHWLCASTPS